MEINEAIIIFTLGLLFGFFIARWLITSAIQTMLNQFKDKIKDLNHAE